MAAERQGVAISRAKALGFSVESLGSMLLRCRAEDCAVIVRIFRVWVKGGYATDWQRTVFGDEATIAERVEMRHYEVFGKDRDRFGATYGLGSGRA